MLCGGVVVSALTHSLLFTIFTARARPSTIHHDKVGHCTLNAFHKMYTYARVYIKHHVIGQRRLCGYMKEKVWWMNVIVNLWFTWCIVHINMRSENRWENHVYNPCSYSCRLFILICFLTIIYATIQECDDDHIHKEEHVGNILIYISSLNK